MTTSRYRERDYAFGQRILTLRTTIGLTQAGLAEFLIVSRRAVTEWEAGNSYPKAEHLKRLLELGVAQQAFPLGQEAEEIRDFWKAARQKVLLDEEWLSALLSQPCLSPTSLRAPMLSADANPLPSVVSPMHTTTHIYFCNIPSALTPLLGRDQQFAAVGELLLRPEVRLVTITGTGGIGKTRLAQQVGTHLLEAFRYGVCFVPLASVRDPDLLIPTIVRTLEYNQFSDIAS